MVERHIGSRSVVAGLLPLALARVTIGRLRVRHFGGVEDDELIVSAGTTYAFTTMRGLLTEEAIEGILNAFPNLKIPVRRSGEQSDAV